VRGEALGASGDGGRGVVLEPRELEELRRAVVGSAHGAHELGEVERVERALCRGDLLVAELGVAGEGEREHLKRELGELGLLVSGQTRRVHPSTQSRRIANRQFSARRITDATGLTFVPDVPLPRWLDAVTGEALEPGACDY
jgi:hypothetical protein